jgi:hypothetical protein
MYPVSYNPVNGIFVHEQVKALKNAGIDIRVVSPKAWSPWPVKHLSKKWKAYSVVPEYDELDGIQVYYPKYLTFPKSLFFASSGKRMYHGIKSTIEQIYKEFPFDLIHAHVALPDGKAASLIAKDFGCPFVVTIHGQDFQQTIFRNRKCHEEIKKTFDKAKGIITVSNKLKRIGVEHFSEAKDKFTVIPNGINVEEFQDLDNASKVEGKRAVPVILSVSNLVKTKGIDLNIKAMSRLRDKYPDIQYLIIGDGNQRETLENLSKETGLENHIKFLGRMPHRSVLQYMKDCDVFSLPSWKEGFGVVYLEAMACGKPVIGCKGEGIEDFVENKKNGLLVEPQNVDSLVEAIDFLLTNPEEAKEIGEEAQERVFKKYSWKGNVAKTISKYREVTRN